MTAIEKYDRCLMNDYYTEDSVLVAEYSGFEIYRSWIVESFTGKIVTGTTIYMITEDEDLVGQAHITLSEAKREIDSWS